MFGWTIDEKTSFDLLDGFVDAGFNAIDTADVYSAWVPGNKGGESETIIGNWLKANPGKRDKVLILTKVGSDMGQGHRDLVGRAGSSRRSRTRCVGSRPTSSISTSRIGRTIDAVRGDARAPTTSLSRPARCGRSARPISTPPNSARRSGSRSRGICRATRRLQPEYNLYDRAAFDGALQRSRDPRRRRASSPISAWRPASFRESTGRRRTSRKASGAGASKSI